MGSSPGRVIVVDGCWPRRRVPQQSAPACPGHPRKQMSGACFRRWGSGRGRNPAAKHIPFRDGDLDSLPVLLGVQPGTFGGPLLAPVPTVQPKSARCKHRPRVDGHPMCLKRPWRPLLSANDHPARYVGKSHLQSAGGGGAGNPDCHTSPAWWSCEQIQAPAENEAYTARAAASGTSATGSPAAAGLKAVPIAGARRDQSRPTRTRRRRGRTRGLGRLRRRPRHRVAGDRDPALRHQAGSAPALPAPTPRRPQPYGSDC